MKELFNEFESLGYDVLSLKGITYGGIDLGLSLSECSGSCSQQCKECKQGCQNGPS